MAKSAFNIKALTVDQLIDLRENIEQMLSSKVRVAKRELEDKLDKLNKFTGGWISSGRKGKPHPAKGRKVAPKYRGPNGETWAGRGIQPRWLQALLKEGHKIEEFATGSTATARTKAPAKRGRRKAK